MIFWVHSKFSEHGEFDIPLEEMNKIYPHFSYEILRLGVLKSIAYEVFENAGVRN